MTSVAEGAADTGEKVQSEKQRAVEKKYKSARRWVIVAICLAGLAVAILAIIGVYYSQPIVTAAAIAILFGSSILFVAGYTVPKSEANPGERLSRYARDPKGYPSLAILQFFVWTGVIIFAFTWIAFIRVLGGVPAFPSAGAAFPANLLAVMGISAGSTLASAAVGTVRPRSEQGDVYPWTTLLEEPVESNGNIVDWRPSLGRFQMFAWTVISIGIFLAILLHEVAPFWNHGAVGNLTLPDLDPTLLVLMGISHTGYVGSKYISLDSLNKAEQRATDSKNPRPEQNGGAAPGAADGGMADNPPTADPGASPRSPPASPPPTPPQTEPPQVHGFPATSPPTRNCPSCRTVIPPGNTYCGVCGKRLH